MANRNFASGGKIYSMHVRPVLIDCNFMVDSSNANGLGISNLKGPLVRSVFMQATTPAPSPSPGSPDLASAASFAVLASSTVTNTGFSVVNGNLGLSPGSSVTGFPPGVVSPPYLQHIGDATAIQARIDASAAYNDLQSRAPGTAEGDLSGLTLGPGTYTSGSTMMIAVGQTLTLDAGGDPDAVWIFQLGSALTINNGASVVIINGGFSRNVYWQVGSSATVGTAATMLGTILANASITFQTGASMDGRLLASVGGSGPAFGAGAVTLDDNAINLPSGSNPTPIAGTPAPGTIVVRLEDNFNQYLKFFKAVVSPTSGTALKVDNAALIAGTAYIITTVGNTTRAQWTALGVPPGVTPAVGVSFVSLTTGPGANTSTSRVMTTALAGSDIATIEVDGDPTLSIAPDPTKNQGFGAQFILQARTYGGAQTAPADGSTISLAFLLNDSGVKVQGE